MAKKVAKKENREPATITNSRARFDYAFEETYEAGIALVGSEVKSLYLGRANLTDAYCRVDAGELVLYNLDIEPYEKTTHFQHERRRNRKLLMHRREIDTIERKSLEKGFTLIPAKLYFKNGRVKVLVALARGKSQYDKRAKIAKDDERRERERMDRL